MPSGPARPHGHCGRQRALTSGSSSEDKTSSGIARPNPSRPDGHVRDGYKRPFDLAILVLAHILLFPVWLVLWTMIPLAIWAGDRGPVLYRQVRVGKNGTVFTMRKFRTMIIGAEERTGPVWAWRGDWRITGVGRFLRRFRLDEIPQVINMWKGEMSLVGPRPERPELVDEFSRSIPGFDARLRVRPGFGGLAQVRGRYSTRPRDKLRYDNLYIEKMTPGLDLKLLIQSLRVVLRGRPH